MPGIKLEQFGGMLPAWDPHLLPTGQAAFSKNGYLFGGNLTGWRQPKRLHTLLNGGARAAYRIPLVQQTQASAFLVFLGQAQDGDTATVGDITYTFKTILTDKGATATSRNQVLIGVDALTTAKNFTQAVTADAGQNTNAATTYGTDTVANGDIYFTEPGTTAPVGKADPSYGSALIGVTYAFASVGAHDFGASFNNVGVSATGGRLQWNYDLLSLAHTTTTLHGGTNPSFDSSITSSSIWLEFNDPYTDVVKSPVAEDQWNRYYFASPSDMPKYNTYDRLSNGDPAWLLGVPPPGCAPVLTVVGGGNSQVLGNPTESGGDIFLQQNRVYLIPFVTTGDTQIIDIQFRLGLLGTPDQNTTPTTNWAGVVYDDDGSSGDVTKPGKPLNLLNTTQLVKGVTNDVPNIASFANPTGLLANTVYWMGIIFDRQNKFEGGPAGGNTNMVYFDAVFTNGPPGTVPASNLVTGQNSINVWGDFVTSDVIESRSYVYTWVTDYGEEGPPSPPTILDGWSNGTWTVGLWNPPPDDLGILRNLKKIKLYRTVPGQGGSTVFFFVDEFTISAMNDSTSTLSDQALAYKITKPNVGNGAYTDGVADSLVALNDQIASTDWFPPPPNMQGMTVMQNGMVAGFVGNDVWFCEPYHPHAWPPGNVLTSDYTIVGLGVTQGNLVVVTSSHPYVISGANPKNMTMQKGSHPNPCLSRGSILSGDKSVTFMSPNGLIQVQASGEAINTTDLWMTRDKWQQLTPQKYTRAIFLTSQYYCLGSVSPPSVAVADNSVAQQGFTIEIDNDTQSFTIWPQPGGHRLGFQVLSSPTSKDILNVMTDPWSGTGMVISDGSVWYFDFADPAPVIVPYQWKSKVYQQNVKRQYSAAKVFFSIPPGSPTPGTRNEAVASDPSWATLGANQYGILKTYVDVDGTGNLTLIDCREITQSGELLRCVDGFKAEQWQWEVLGRVNISNIQVATSPKELGSV